MDHRPSEELLESVHEFPGIFQIKAIGLVDQNFENLLVEAVASELVSPSTLDVKVRTTPGGRHVSVTLEITVQSAQHVRTIYDRIHKLAGLVYLL